MTALLVPLGLAQVLTVAFYHPPQQQLPERFDAVFVTSGDRGDRLDRALALADAGSTATVVILRPSDGPVARARALCARTDLGYSVECSDPSLVSTIGDAREIGRLTRERQWSSIVVATSRFHVARTRVIVERCTDASVSLAGSRPDFGARQWLGSMIREVGGLIELSLLHRGC